jgi:hypothetical protein
MVRQAHQSLSKDVAKTFIKTESIQNFHQKVPIVLRQSLAVLSIFSRCCGATRISPLRGMVEANSSVAGAPAQRSATERCTFLA